MKKTMMCAAIVIAMAITPMKAFADDVSIDANGNVKAGVASSGNLEVTGASAEKAIVGQASGTSGAGVYGINNTFGNYGFLGYDDGASNYGVYGYSSDGYGGYFGSGYIAVYGYSAGGWAGYFQGNARVTGNLTVDGTFSAPNLDADTVDGSHASAFAASGHNHDFTYINEGQVNSVDGTMIVDGVVTDGKISGPISGSKLGPHSHHALDAADGSPADAVYVNNSGNVGIGTTTPGSKLTVAGTIESTNGGVKYPDGTVQTSAFPFAGQSCPPGHYVTGFSTDGRFWCNVDFWFEAPQESRLSVYWASYADYQNNILSVDFRAQNLGTETAPYIYIHDVITDVPLVTTLPISLGDIPGWVVY